MSKPAAFFGSYVDAKFMRGLKVTRVMIDIPIESTNAFLTAFGAPDGVNPVPVAIARLIEGAYAPDENGPGNRSESSRPNDSMRDSAKDQDKPRTYTRSQMAAIKCQDRDFKAWLAKQFPSAYVGKGFGGDNAACEFALKELLGIQSKKELDSNPEKAADFDRMLATFDVRDLVRR